MYKFKGTMVDNEDGNDPYIMEVGFATEDKNVAIIAAICSIHYGWKDPNDQEPDLEVVREWLGYYNLPDLLGSETDVFLDEDAVCEDAPDWSPHFSCEDATLIYRDRVKGARPINLSPEVAKALVAEGMKKYTAITLAKEGLTAESASCDIELF